MNKKQIRKHHLGLRMQLSTSDLDIFSNKINSKIIDLIEKINPISSVGLFYPYKNEVDVLRISNDLINKNIKCSLPKVISKGSSLKYFEYNPHSPNLEKGFGGIMEPKGEKALDPDIIIASCSAFNEKGFRVGYGGGFFDRTIEELKKKGNLKTILAAFEIQKTNYNFQESFDQKVDYICSEQKIYSL